MTKQKQWLKKVIEHKGLDSKPYLDKFNQFDKVRFDVGKYYDFYTNSIDDKKITISIVKDVNGISFDKLISFYKCDIENVGIIKNIVQENDIGSIKSYKVEGLIESNHTVKPVEIQGYLKNQDQGSHYRYKLEHILSEEEISAGVAVIELDPFLVAKTWDMSSFALQTVLKKIARSGKGGYKDYETDIKDCICALQRELQLIQPKKILTDKGMGEK